MKKIACCAALVLVLNTLVFAQKDSLKNASVQERSEAMALKMQRELSLSPEQTQSIIPILKKRLDNFGSLKTDKSQSLSKINEQSKNSLQKILTKDQFSQFKSLQLETKKQKDAFAKQHPNYVFSDEEKVSDF